jgi:hypothetical protein
MEDDIKQNKNGRQTQKDDPNKKKKSVLDSTQI